MGNQPPFFAIAYYHFVELDNPEQEVERYKNFFNGRDIKGRIYFSKDGVNAQISATRDASKEFLSWLREDPRFQDADVKLQACGEHAFYKMTVKARKQLVAFDTDVDLDERGEHLSPEAWKEKMEQKDPNTVVVDVRNRYESEVGHFEGAILPDCQTFREFPQFAEDLKEKVDPEKGTVMMYCTGGIRCEYYSSFLKKKGFKQVFQLHGGVIQYGLKEGSKNWKGKLFVFDDRLVVPIAEEKNETVGSCKLCQTEEDTYYNCANMDCNELFVACPGCLEKHKGCCSEGCMHSPRVRAYDRSEHPKPFRKWSYQEKLRWKEPAAQSEQL
jgi:UPF0176 protein